MDIREIESVEVCTTWVVAIHTVTLRRSAGFAACFLKAEVEFTRFHFGRTRPMNAAFILE